MQLPCRPTRAGSAPTSVFVHLDKPLTVQHRLQQHTAPRCKHTPVAGHSDQQPGIYVHVQSFLVHVCFWFTAGILRIGGQAVITYSLSDTIHSIGGL